MQEVLREQVFDEVKDDINPKLDKKDVENKRVLFWQGETIKSRKDLTERPNPRYAVAPMWSNVNYDLSFITAKPKDIAKV